ncbi:ROK family protein [Croceibacterium mercuriale]|uniref:ROK family protein n=1 Tax=Croceibacterium mercuriale TaxID=1572751 RepID=UPI00069080E5|nr:ROK family protein [Croceibacterium mercuriale]
MHQPTTSAAPLSLGIDFGGTKIEANVLDPAGSVLWRDRVPNPGTYPKAVAAIGDLVGAAEQALGARCTIGVGTPGSPSPRTGIMRNSNSQYLNGKPFGSDLEAALDRPVRLANDANCLALSEAFDGAAAGVGSVFGLIIGTGVGGGLVLDGALLDGAHGIAGEIGHLPVPWPQGAELDPPPCWCGLAGCCETWVSGKGFARAFHAEHGQTLTAPEIVAAARNGDPAAKQALTDYTDRLGRVLAQVANLLDPDVMVLGGGMSNVAELYPALPAIVRHHAFSDLWDGRIVPARWGDASGVRGAARLWPAAGTAEHQAAG